MALATGARRDVGTPGNRSIVVCESRDEELQRHFVLLSQSAGTLGRTKDTPYLAVCQLSRLLPLSLREAFKPLLPENPVTYIF